MVTHAGGGGHLVSVPGCVEEGQQRLQAAGVAGDAQLAGPDPAFEIVLP